jgi:predicted ABC-type transport system involved in lysophospholipase L1 biosynthesis ATPase subunit
VLELLLEMNRVHGTALVVVTHSPDLALRLGRRVELVDGYLVEGLGADPELVTRPAES